MCIVCGTGHPSVCIGHKVSRLRLMESTLGSSLLRGEEAALEASSGCSAGGSVGPHTRICSSDKGARVSGPHRILAVRSTTIPRRGSRL
jgi:hypothetical protein